MRSSYYIPDSFGPRSTCAYWPHRGSIAPRAHNIATAPRHVGRRCSRSSAGMATPFLAKASKILANSAYWKHILIDWCAPVSMVRSSFSETPNRPARTSNWADRFNVLRSRFRYLHATSPFSGMCSIMMFPRLTNDHHSVSFQTLADYDLD